MMVTSLRTLSASLLLLFFVDSSFAQNESANSVTELRSDTVATVSILQSALDPAMAFELELVDDQRKQMSELHRELMGLINGYGQATSGPEKQALLFKLHASALKARSETDRILLPHQRRRIDELKFQNGLSKDKLSVASYWILDPNLNKRLEISADQEEVVEQKSKKLWKETQQKIQDLRAQIKKVHTDAQRKLLEELSQSQRKKYIELIGEPLLRK
jgi:Spy/CpxP family protein refolding chaperone